MRERSGCRRLPLNYPLFAHWLFRLRLRAFAALSGTLQEGGLPLIESLRISRETMGNVVLEKVISDAEEKILAGSTLSKELIKVNIIPPMVSRMLAVGEESGTAVSMLKRIADMYEGELGKIS